MADSGNTPPVLTREMVVAFTAAVAALVVFLTIFDWGPLPAVVGGFSIGVIWWSMNRALNRPQ